MAPQAVIASADKRIGVKHFVNQAKPSSAVNQCSKPLEDCDAYKGHNNPEATISKRIMMIYLVKIGITRRSDIGQNYPR